MPPEPQIEPQIEPRPDRTRSLLSLRRAPGVKRLSTLSVVALLAGTLSSATAAAETRKHRDDRYRAHGRVIDVRPVYAEVAVREPVRHCRGSRSYRHDRYERPGRHHRDQRPFGRDDGYRRHKDRGQRSGAGGAILGGVIGGTVGNRIARHDRRDTRVAATVAGALIGSAIGHGVSRSHDRHARYQRGHRPHRRPVERCHDSVTTRYETRLRHYDITYVFRGRTFHTTRSRDPGERIEIDVSQRPSRR